MYIASTVFGLVGIFFLAWWVVPRVMVTLTKAAPAKQMSVANSYLIGEKILAMADGKDKCRVNVFVLDADGKGVPSKEVMVEGLPGGKNVTEVTDKEGKAVVEFVSTEEKQFQISARVDGVSLSRTLTVTFRN